jgi:hypothetical protein
MHRLEAVVAWIGDHAPFAQLSHRGGFILAAEGDMASQLNTGTEHWKTRRLQGWSFEPGPRPGFVGAKQTIDGSKWFAPEAGLEESGRDLPGSLLATNTASCDRAGVCRHRPCRING